MIQPAALMLATALQVASQTAAVEDPAVRAAVERFYEMQQKEDVAGYLSLWSTTAKRPLADQLKFIFDSGDDTFSDIQITRATPAGNRVRVRVAVRRERSSPPRIPGGPPRVFASLMRVALTFEKENGSWKLLREGAAEDDLAAELVDAPTNEEREALLAAEPDLMGVPLLTALARLGSSSAMTQDYARSQAIFEQLVALARRTGHRKEEGEGLQNIANALYFRRRFAEALDAYQQRLAIERERGDDAAVASALGGIATIRYSFADYTEALARYREALAIHERLDDVAGVAFAALSIGNIAYLQGDFPPAIAAYRRSLELNRTMFNMDGESRALEGLGLVLTAQGDYAGALESFDTVLKDPRMRTYRGRLGAVAQNAGDVHFRLGNLDAARTIYEESRAHFESLKDMANVGRVLQSVALTELVAGRFAQAEELYKRSGATCATVDDKDCSARATAGFAYTQAAQDKFWDAAASYRKAVTEFTALGRREDAGRSEVGLSQALAGAEDFAGAVDAAVRARTIATAVLSDDVLWRGLTAEARAVQRNGDKERALSVARSAVAVLDRMHALALDKPGASLPADSAGAFATYAILQAETGDAVGAFATSERLRALDLRGGIATNERDVARGMTPEEREEERVLATGLQTRLAQVAREKGLPKPDTARIATLEKAVTEATEARRAWMQRLFDRLPDLRLWRGLAPPRSAPDAAPLVTPPGSLLLSFVLDDENLLVLTVTGSDPSTEGSGESRVRVDAHVTPVKRRQVAERVAALQHPDALADVAVWRKTIADVVTLMPERVAAQLASASSVLIIPHDVLWRVPFAALPSGEGFLIDHATVSIGGSVESLLRSMTTSPSAGDSMVAVGGLDLPAARLERLKQAAPGWFVRAAERADIEMKTAVAAYGSERATVFTRDRATEGAVRSRAPDAAILHIAAPFRINAASPLFSPILLSVPEPTAPALPASPSVESASQSPPATPAPTPAPQAPAPAAPVKRDTTEDGTLELREVVNLNFRARVVVFSDGASTSMRDGAAAADVLHWGWLASGVSTVVLSRWMTPATATERLMTTFYEQLQRGVALPEALRAAQLAVRGVADTAAPVNWAGWMLVGR